jgi:hypothetical protein
MKSSPPDAPRFVVCIEAPDEYSLDLSPHRIYEVIPDASAERSGWIRIVDDSGEDYLYSEDWFRPIEVPQALSVELQALSKGLRKAS